MRRTLTGVILAVGLLAVLPGRGRHREAPRAASTVRATRLPTNPLVTVETSPTLGDNVNGPAVIRVPEWIRRPLGRYYMYFAHHRGTFIRLAYADAVAGPWKVYEPGVLHVRQTALFRPPPGPPRGAPVLRDHVASPEIYVDEARRRIVLWFHGWWTNGRRWNPRESELQTWLDRHGYGQFTQVAESADGLAFQVRPVLSRESYIRAFRHAGRLYGMARLGRLLRAKGPLAPFELGPNPFRDGPYANRVRHVALLDRGSRLMVFFSAIGDAPERILMSEIDLEGAWERWRTSSPSEVLRPEEPYECADLPNAPSGEGLAKGPVRQLRDPAVLEDGDRTYLFYTICGERGIAAAELRFAPE
jgi:hypothetical protein